MILNLLFYLVSTVSAGNVQYQITPTTLPQGVVMAAAPGTTIASPQQIGEEASRKRELRLLKNRYKNIKLLANFSSPLYRCIATTVSYNSELVSSFVLYLGVFYVLSSIYNQLYMNINVI